MSQQKYTERKLIVSVILRAVKDYLDGNNPYKINRLKSKGHEHEVGTPPGRCRVGRRLCSSVP